MTDNDEPVARITLTAVYAEVRTLTEAVTKLTERLPAHVEATDTKLSEHSKRLTDQERRLRLLESRMWLAVGAFGLIAAASPYLSRIFIP